MEVKVYVMRKTLDHLKNAIAMIVGLEGFSDPLLFVGGPLIDIVAKSYALQQSILWLSVLICAI